MNYIGLSTSAFWKHLRGGQRQEYIIVVNILILLYLLASLEDMCRKTNSDCRYLRLHKAMLYRLEHGGANKTEQILPGSDKEGSIAGHSKRDCMRSQHQYLLLEKEKK